MKIKANAKGVCYAHLRGHRPINLKTKDQKEAQRLVREAKLEELEFASRAKLLTAEVVQRLSAGGRITGAKALDRWKEVARQQLDLSPSTLHSYAGHIDRFLKVTRMKDTAISRADFSHVDSFINADDGASVSTRNMRKASLESFFNVCSADGAVIRNPAALARVKLHKLSFAEKEPAVREPFTSEEIDLLQSIDDPFWSAAIELGLEYGLRLSDIAQLEWDSFNKPGVIVVWTDKHDRRIELPLTHRLVGLLPERRGQRYVFPEQAAIAQDFNRRAHLSVQFRRLVQRLGISDKTFHCLRHTFATRRAKAGQNIDEIRLSMGHVSTETTAGYVHS
jgi:integrase